MVLNTVSASKTVTPEKNSQNKQLMSTLKQLQNSWNLTLINHIKIIQNEKNMYKKEARKNDLILNILSQLFYSDDVYNFQLTAGFSGCCSG